MLTEPQCRSNEVKLAQKWTHVLSKNKELCIYVTWRWLRLGYVWDAESEEKMKLRDNSVVLI